jgi:hypothetical protein
MDDLYRKFILIMSFVEKIAEFTDVKNAATFYGKFSIQLIPSGIYLSRISVGNEVSILKILKY